MKMSFFTLWIIMIAFTANAQVPAGVLQEVCSLRFVASSFDDEMLPWRQAPCMTFGVACNSDARACERYNDIKTASENKTIASLIHLQQQCYSGMNLRCCRYLLAGRLEDLDRAMNAYGSALRAGRVTDRSYENQSLELLCP